MKLKSSLILVSAIMAATVLTLGLSTWLGMHRLGQLQDQGFEAAQLSSQARDLSNVGARLYQVIADSIINRHLDESEKLWAEKKNEALNELEGIERNLDSEERKALVRGARADVEQLASLFENKELPMLHARPIDMDAISRIDDDMDKAVKDIDEKLDILSSMLLKEAIDGDAHFDGVQDTLLTITGLAGFGALAAVCFLQWRNFKQIFGQLGGEPTYAAEVTREIARGNLGREVTLDARYPGSLLHEMSSMRHALREIVGLLQHSANAVNRSAQELADASSQVTEGTAAQSDAAAHMAAAVEQLTVSVAHVSDNTQAVKHEAEEAGQRSLQGADIVDKAVCEMDRVATAVTESASQMQQLGNESRNIASVVNVIREVADQTNLLALNAAIEAARAGEQGRGFAVVADEVRKLAERTGNSTSEIGAMVERILSGTQTAVSGVEAGTQQVARGVELVTQAGTEMQRIRAGATQLIGSVDEIAVALKEQKAASEIISRDIERVAQMAEESNNAAASVARSVNDLRDEAADVNRIAARFRL